MCCYLIQDFRAHLVYKPTSLLQSCFVHRASSSALVSSVHTPPSYKVRQKLHIWYTYALMALVYAHQIFSHCDLKILNGSHFGTFR